jgi:hypothetical protein
MEGDRGRDEEVDGYGVEPVSCCPRASPQPQSRCPNAHHRGRRDTSVGPADARLRAEVVATSTNRAGSNPYAAALYVLGGEVLRQMPGEKRFVGRARSTASHSHAVQMPHHRGRRGRGDASVGPADARPRAEVVATSHHPGWTEPSCLCALCVLGGEVLRQLPGEKRFVGRARSTASHSHAVQTPHRRGHRGRGGRRDTSVGPADARLRAEVVATSTTLAGSNPYASATLCVLGGEVLRQLPRRGGRREASVGAADARLRAEVVATSHRLAGSNPHASAASAVSALTP